MCLWLASRASSIHMSIICPEMQQSLIWETSRLKSYIRGLLARSALCEPSIPYALQPAMYCIAAEYTRRG